MSCNNCMTLNNGVKMPMVGLGVFLSQAGEETRSAVRTALETGYRHIDTAQVYCNEKSVGRGIADSGVDRKEVFITTKLWHTDFSNPRKGLEDSLARLGTDYIDLYLLHWPFPGFQQAWLELEKLQAEGKCRAIGVSNFKEHHLDELRNAGAKVVPQVNQVECHPEFSQLELLNYTRKHGIALEAWFPLGGQGGTLVNDPRIMAIASHYKVSAAQVLLRWNIQRGVIVIPKSVHADRIRMNFDVFSFDLSGDDMDVLDELNQNKRRGIDPDNCNSLLDRIPVQED